MKISGFLILILIVVGLLFYYSPETLNKGIQNIKDVKLPIMNNQSCNPDWIPQNWSSCINGTKLRECIDKNNCDYRIKCFQSMEC